MISRAEAVEAAKSVNQCSGHGALGPCREKVCIMARYILQSPPASPDFASGRGAMDILRELIDDLQVPNSLGVYGSDFTTCLGCSGGSYPGKDGYVHGKGCPVEKAEKALAALGIGTQPTGPN